MIGIKCSFEFCSLFSWFMVAGSFFSTHTQKLILFVNGLPMSIFVPFVEFLSFFPQDGKTIRTYQLNSGIHKNKYLLNTHYYTLLLIITASV